MAVPIRPGVPAADHRHQVLTAAAAHRPADRPEVPHIRVRRRAEVRTGVVRPAVRARHQAAGTPLAEALVRHQEAPAEDRQGAAANKTLQTQRLWEEYITCWHAE